MKKLFATLFLASALCLTGCGASESSSSVKGKLDSNGYTTTYYSAEAAKEYYGNKLTFAGFNLVDAVYGTKGTGDNADFFLVFFFNDIDQASNFLTAGDNVVVFNNTMDNYLGKNLTHAMGSKNNATYCGSSTAFSIAF